MTEMWQLSYSVWRPDEGLRGNEEDEEEVQYTVMPFHPFTDIVSFPQSIIAQKCVFSTHSNESNKQKALLFSMMIYFASNSIHWIISDKSDNDNKIMNT